MTIAVSFGFNLFFLLAKLLNVKVLHEAPIEFAEAFLVLLVQEYLLDVASVLQSLIQLVEKRGLQIATFHTRCATITAVQSHGEYRGRIRVASCR